MLVFNTVGSKGCVYVCVCRHSSEGGSKKVALKLSVPEAKVVASSLEEMEDGEDSKTEQALQQVKESLVGTLQEISGHTHFSETTPKWPHPF